jgi:hypothetical protein
VAEADEHQRYLHLRRLNVGILGHLMGVFVAWRCNAEGLKYAKAEIQKRARFWERPEADRHWNRAQPGSEKGPAVRGRLPELGELMMDDAQTGNESCGITPRERPDARGCLRVTTIRLRGRLAVQRRQTVPEIPEQGAVVRKREASHAAEPQVVVVRGTEQAVESPLSNLVLFTSPLNTLKWPVGAK